jgi:DNA repair protein RadC
VAHNHPNGKTNPTREDINLTGRIVAAADTLDMDFDDHLILTPYGGWASMRALGHL